MDKASYLKVSMNLMVSENVWWRFIESFFFFNFASEYQSWEAVWKKKTKYKSKYWRYHRSKRWGVFIIHDDRAPQNRSETKDVQPTRKQRVTVSDIDQRVRLRWWNRMSKWLSSFPFHRVPNYECLYTSEKKDLLPPAFSCLGSSGCTSCLMRKLINPDSHH